MTTTSSIKFLVLVSLFFGLVLAQSDGNFRRKPGRTQNRTRPPQTTLAYENDDETSDCPEPYGYFADAEQCDKYYACNDNRITEKLCPDGMVFNDYSADQEKCDLPLNIDCSKRSKLQTPIPSLHCVRQNGYFSHEQANVCDQFYYCVDGMFNMITCPAGLVFNQKTGICTWPDEAHKVGCSSEELFKFTCPPVNETYGLTHPRYADPEDCQFFYVCINGNVPRRNGCKLGQAFDEVTKRCDWARNIPECADWYKGQLTDAELDALENPKTTTVRTRVKGASRRKFAKKPPPPDPIRDEDDDE